MTIRLSGLRPGHYTIIDNATNASIDVLAKYDGIARATLEPVGPVSPRTGSYKMPSGLLLHIALSNGVLIAMCSNSTSSPVIGRAEPAPWSWRKLSMEAAR